MGFAPAIQNVRHRLGGRAYSLWKSASSRFRPKVPRYSPKTLAEKDPGKPHSTKFSEKTLEKMYPTKPGPRPRRPPRFHTKPFVFPADPMEGYPQNLDLPATLDPDKKKPYIRPIEDFLREFYRNKRLGTARTWKAPHNGMLLERYIPLAHELLKEYNVLEEGIRRIMEQVPVKACTVCMEIHIGAAGHKIQSCQGMYRSETMSLHRWIRAYPEDVLLPIEAYHVHDKLRPDLRHEQRYTTPRISAVRELCLHAGVDDPEFPMIRWARKSGRQVGDGQAQTSLPVFLNVIRPGFSDDEGEATKKQVKDQRNNAMISSSDQGRRQDELQKVKQDDGSAEVTNCKGYKEPVEEPELEAELKQEDDGLSSASEEDGLSEQEEEDESLEAEQEAGTMTNTGLHFYDNEQGPESSSDDDTEAEKHRLEIREKYQQAQAKAQAQIEEEKLELKAVAERTLVAYEKVRSGVRKLMNKYTVWACGYCPEVHVGWKGHSVRFCAGAKREARHGHHGWQEAALSDVLPPNFVWHVPAGKSPELSNELKQFYGQAPAVVELCVQAGAEVPAKWKPYMRMDVIVPEDGEHVLAA